ncbi:hypothetical protein [Cupriavidus numazuensis]|uniref:Phasin domain-containing protein n=1 Tax=Cupriavidus numazuensis TaxID=221992 RepID=A0ABN7QAF3_9BURK|nr:hypothetical protein [Cupriavidus numazuensis]CAG2158674.1 hypothetical protein LMG26411_06116 [Cupriavidus numazuensis]
MAGIMMSPKEPAPTAHNGEAAQAFHHALLQTPPAAAQRALTLQTLMGEWAMRTGGTATKALTLAPFSFDPQVMTELVQLQSAIAQRLQAQQQVWVQQWSGWLQERGQVRRANTVSKLVEQEFDLLARFVLLLSDQMLDLVTLQENVEVNGSYWVQQVLEAKVDGVG